MIDSTHVYVNNVVHIPTLLIYMCVESIIFLAVYLYKSATSCRNPQSPVPVAPQSPWGLTPTPIPRVFWILVGSVCLFPLYGYTIYLVSICFLYQRNESSDDDMQREYRTHQ